MIDLNQYQRAFRQARKEYAARTRQTLEEASEKAHKRHARRATAARRRMLESARFADELGTFEGEF